MIIMESWWWVTSKSLGTEGKGTKYNIDYVTTGSIFERALWVSSDVCNELFTDYSKINITNNNSEPFIHIFPSSAPKLRKEVTSQVKIVLLLHV